jgi:hypothetical protein
MQIYNEECAHYLKKFAEEEWRHDFQDFQTTVDRLSRSKIDILSPHGIPLSYRKFIVGGFFHKKMSKEELKKFSDYYWSVLNKYIDEYKAEYYAYYWASAYVEFDIIKHNPQITWNYNFVMTNPNITWEIILENPSFPWDFFNLSYNTNITFDIVKQNPDPMSTLRAAAQKLGLQMPPAPTADHEELIYRKKCMWNYFNMTYHIPVETILENINHDWDFVWLSGNKIKMEHVLAYPHKKWSIFELSTNPNITMEDIVAHQEFDWDYDEVSYNPNFTLETPQKYPWIQWSLKNYSLNRNIDLEVIKNNPDFKWNYEYLSSNPSTPVKYILSTPEKKWNYYSISHLNSNITLDLLKSWIKSPKINLKSLGYGDNIYNLCVKDYNNYVKYQTQHFDKMKSVHAELLAVLFSPENYWYMENLK